MKAELKPEELKIRTLNIHFGALCDPIAKQVKDQGFSFDGKQMLRFQEQHEAILRLRFANILTDSMMDKAHEKLFKYIKEHVNISQKPKRTNL